MLVGTLALTLAVLGLFDLWAGSPATAHGRAHAGGLIGAGVAAPLERGLSAVIAVPLLFLLGVFGILVVTATPISQLCEHLACAARTPASPKRRRRARWPNRGKVVRTVRTRRARTPEHRHRPPRSRSSTIRSRTARPPTHGPGRRSRASRAMPKVESMTTCRRSTARCSSSCSGGGAVHAAVAQGSRAGQPAPGAHQGQRRGDRRPAAGVRRVRRRLRGHRLQPRPDRHPLRGRARPRRQGRADHQPHPQHRLRGQERRRADPQPDPGQERGRRRDPERRPGDRHARRRAALAGRAARSPPDARRARQGRRGRLRRCEPDEDAAPARRRSDRRRQVELHQHADPVGPDPGDARTRCGWCSSTPSGSSSRPTRASRTWSRR